MSSTEARSSILYGFSNSSLHTIDWQQGTVTLIGGDEVSTIAGAAFVALDDDCNDNLLLDACELEMPGADVNSNGILDECED